MPNLFQAPPQNPILLQQAQDPRTALAQSLIAAASNARPVNSPWEGIARLGSGLAGALIARNAGKEYKQRGENYNATLAQALQAAQPWKAPDNIMNEAGDQVVVPRGQEAPGTGGMGALVAALRGNPDTAPMALNLQFEDMTRRQGITDQQDAARFAQNLAIEGAPRMQAAQLPGAIAQAQGIGGVNNDLAVALAKNLGPINTQNAVTQAQALGPVQAANAGLTAAAQQPYEMDRIGAQARATAANQPPRGPGGIMGGTSIEAQDSNILLQGNPVSPEYAMAYARQSQPKVTVVDGMMTTVKPDMSWARPPGGAPQAQGAQQPAPGATAPPALAGGPQAVPGAPNVTTQRVGDPAKLKTAQVGVESIVSALDRFGEVAKGSDFWTRAGAATGLEGTEGGRLNTTYNNAALLAKGEELFNLGVLNGPDLDIIRRTLTDPSTLQGLRSSPEKYQAQIDEIKRLVTDRLHSMEKQAGVPLSTFGAKAQIYVNPTTGEKVQWDGKAYVPVP